MTDTATELRLCVAPQEARRSGPWVRAAIWRGGPDAIRKTAHSLEADCASQRVRLRDSQGVIYAETETRGDEPAAVLARELCGNSPR